MFEQAELRGTSMGPSGPPNAKATAKIAPGISILGTLAFLVLVILVILASHFRARADLQQIEPMRGVAQINETELCAGFAEFTSTGS